MKYLRRIGPIKMMRSAKSFNRIKQVRGGHVTVDLSGEFNN